MHGHNRRPGTSASPIACPDCNGVATPTPGTSLPGPAPRVEHEPTCPIARAAARLFHSDRRWLDAHPAAVARIRHLHHCEADDMATALGKRVPRPQRSGWRVVVTRHESGGVGRTYFDTLGRCRVAQIATTALPAGAR